MCIQVDWRPNFTFDCRYDIICLWMDNLSLLPTPGANSWIFELAGASPQDELDWAFLILIGSRKTLVLILLRARYCCLQIISNRSKLFGYAIANSKMGFHLLPGERKWLRQIKVSKSLTASIDPTHWLHKSRDKLHQNYTLKTLMNPSNDHLLKKDFLIDDHILMGNDFSLFLIILTELRESGK